MSTCPIHPEHDAADCRPCQIDVAISVREAKRIPLRELVDHFRPDVAPTPDTTQETEE
jgi:hypothetical protein